MDTPLTGKHALVTGAGRGIGLAIARTLAAQGAVVTLVGRDAGRLAEARAAIGDAHHAVAADVTDPAGVANAFAAARARHGPVAILVNNAGQAGSAPFAKTTLELVRRLMAVNFEGTFLCTQAALPDMTAAKWGRIVNVASTAGLIGYAYVSAYVASKHAVVGLTRSLALETARAGITVNAVCPGYTETDIVREAIDNIMKKTGMAEKEARAALTGTNPQARLVMPEEVAAAVAWLCAPGSAAITGQAIAVAGGEVMVR